jgi:hypothetical protein
VLAFASCVTLLCAAPLGAADQAPGPIAAAAMAEGRRLGALAADVRQPESAPDQDRVELRWGELGPVIVGQRVEVLLTDRTKVAGDVLVVREDAIVMDLGKNRRSGTVARENVALIRLERMTGTGGRKLGTVIGVISGLFVGGYVTGRYVDSAGAGILSMITISSGFTIGGYLAGRSLDRKITTIHVTP